MSPSQNCAAQKGASRRRTISVCDEGQSTERGELSKEILFSWKGNHGRIRRGARVRGNITHRRMNCGSKKGKSEGFTKAAPVVLGGGGSRGSPIGDEGRKPHFYQVRTVHAPWKKKGEMRQKGRRPLPGRQRVQSRRKKGVFSATKTATQGNRPQS